MVSPPDDGPLGHAQERADPLACQVVDIGQLEDRSESRLAIVQCLDDDHYEIQCRIDMQDAVPHSLPLVRSGRQLPERCLALASDRGQMSKLGQDASDALLSSADAAIV